MNSKILIIANFNYLNSCDYNRGNSNKYLHENVQYFFDRNWKVYITNDFLRTIAILKMNLYCPVYLFSNFPSDETYQKFELITIDKKHYYQASRYDLSFANFKELLSINPNINLHITTGASTKSFTNSDIQNISNSHKITVKRKREWESFNHENHLNYIKSVIKGK